VGATLAHRSDRRARATLVGSQRILSKSGPHRLSAYDRKEAVLINRGRVLGRTGAAQGPAALSVVPSSSQRQRRFRPGA